jgi:hypothetical protein
MNAVECSPQYTLRPNKRINRGARSRVWYASIGAIARARSTLALGGLLVATKNRNDG